MRADTLEVTRPAPTRPARPALIAVAVVAVVGGVVLRFLTASELWLDEALSVNIARAPIRELPELLRRDGAPPLYYVLLHAWMELFGDGNLAVRSLSGVISVASLPLAWLAGRRIAGTRGAWVSLALFASSPFAIRYATEARMYALVQLLVLAGYLLVTAALVRPRIPVLVGIAVTSGLLALTHYWSLYLLAVVMAALLIRAWRDVERRGAAVRVVVAIAAGGLLFVPWLGVFLFQAAHTGTPWGVPANPFDALQTTLNDFGGGPWPETRLLGLLIAVMIGLALLGRAVDGRRIELDLRTRPGARVEAGIAAATFALAIVASYASRNAFASRYTSVVFPLALLVAAVGVRAFADRRLRVGVVAVLVALGLVGSLRNVFVERTQAGEAAALIAGEIQPGDVVAACPDQLAVAVGRLLPPDAHPVAFPDLDDSGVIDWVDYEARNAADPDEFTEALLDLAGPDSTIWLVWAPGYRTLDNRCERISGALAANRPGSEIVLERDPEFFESMYVTRAPAP